MKILLSAFLLLLISLHSKAQVDFNDSISIYESKLANATEDSSRVVFALNVSKFLLTVKPDSCVYYCTIGLTIAQGMHPVPNRSMALAYNAMGNAWFRNNDFLKAINCYDSCILISEEINFKEPEIFALGNKATIEVKFKQYYPAIANYKKVLPLLTDPRKKAIILGDIGSAFLDLKDYPNALIYFQMSLKITDSIGDVSGSGHNHQNISDVCFDLKRYYEALQHNDTALKIFKITDERSIYIYTAIRKGFLYSNVPDSALKAFGVQPSQKLNKAYEITSMALKMAIEDSSLSDQRDAYNTISGIYEKQRKYAEALDAYKSFAALQDTILTTSFTQAIADSVQYARGRFDSELKTIIKLQAKKDEEQSENIFHLFIAAIGFVVFGTFFLLVTRLLKKKLPVTVIKITGSFCLIGVVVAVELALHYFMAIHVEESLQLTFLVTAGALFPITYVHSWIEERVIKNIGKPKVGSTPVKSKPKAKK